MKKITGIGGVFIKSANAQNLNNWYKTLLGINGTFFWNSVDGKECCTMWDALPASARMFANTDRNFAISYRVEDLDALMKELKASGIIPTGSAETGDNGKFEFINDPEGNRIVLWQPGKTTPRQSSVPDRVTGLGGVFFKSADVKVLGEWYAKHLGIEATEWGYNFQWIDPNVPKAKEPATTVWNPFKADTTYFNPSKSEFMLNYRVKNLGTLIQSLETAGVTIAGKMEEYSYGKFAWIMDPDNNKIELWEPIDDGF